MNDLRDFSRENVNVKCTIYIASYFELICRLVNISESGVLLEVPYCEGVLDKLKVGNELDIQGVDYINGDSFVFQEVSTVIRIEPYGGCWRVACKVSGEDLYYKNYVKALKTLVI